MNSKTQTALCFLALVLSVSCHKAALENIRAKEFANDFLGQQIVDTVLLQQQSGGSADVVIRLLEGLVNDLKNQQQKHDTEHTEKNTFWANQLSEYEAEVDRLTKLIASLDAKIDSKKAAIRKSLHDIKVTEEQQKLVTEKKVALAAAREEDKAAHEKRNSRQSEMLKGVNFIIGELEVALAGKAFVQLNNIKAALAKLVKENPLMALVQLTMTFNPKSVQFAITKLTEVKVGLEASIKSDLQGEADAIVQFNNLNGQFDSFLHDAAQQLEAQQTLLAKQRSELAELEKQRTEAIASKNIQLGLIADVKAAREAYNKIYEDSKVKRASEQATIGRVIEIISVATPASNKAEALKFTPKAA